MDRMTRNTTFSREHTPGSSILAVLTALLLLMAGLSGCISTDDYPLRDDLRVEMERSFATDHIWQPEGPRTPFNEDQIYILLYLTLRNRGDSDLHFDDMSFWLRSSVSSNFWSPILMTMFGVALEEDPRFIEGSLETWDIILPPGDSVAGWTLFDPSYSFMEEDVLEIRATHGNSDEPVFRIDVPVDDVEVDWSVPPMLTVEPDWPTHELLRLQVELNGRPDVAPLVHIEVVHPKAPPKPKTPVAPPKQPVEPVEEAPAPDESEPPDAPDKEPETDRKDVI